MPSSILATTAPFGFDFDPVRLLAAYRALGCTRAQFYRNEDNAPTVAQALAAVGEAGLAFDSIHGVFGFNYDPSSPDSDHRRHCLSVYEAEGRLALDLGGTMVVVHPAAWNPDRYDMSPAEAHAAQGPRWPRLDEFLKRLADVGQRLGVMYLIENQPFNCPLGHDPPALAQHVQAAASPFIRMCFDTGHAHITGDAAGALRACAPAVAYLHIHDNDSQHDDHRIPGDGTIDWRAMAPALSQVEPAAPRMLEVFYDEPRVEALHRAGYSRKLRDHLGL